MNAQERAEPLVSVCLPTYNRAAKLKRAVDCLLACTYRNLEIIIADNASSDGTEAYCRALAQQDARIRYFRHPQNTGAAYNFNFAKAQGTGKYFIWHGDDDYLDGDFIEKCVQQLEADETVMLAAGLGAYHRDSGELSHYGNVIQLTAASPILRACRYLWLVGENSIFCGLYRTSITNRFDPPNCLGGDWVWVIEVLMHGKAVVIPDVYIHREYETSSSSSYVRLVASLGLPAWYARYPWLAICVSFSRYFVKMGQGMGLSRFYVGCLIFCTCMVVLARATRSRLRTLMMKLPLLRPVYRRLRKSLLGYDEPGEGSAK